MVLHFLAKRTLAGIATSETAYRGPNSGLEQAKFLSSLPSGADCTGCGRCLFTLSLEGEPS
jgi:hypothetical protein